MNENNKFGKNGTHENRRPLDSGFVSLGLGKGIKWTLWENNVTFQRQEKQVDTWQTTEELHAPLTLLKEIVWRGPHWLKEIDAKMQEKKEF